MQITINGTQRDVAVGTTLAQLLNQLELNQKQVAVEVNRSVVPREEYFETSLQDGDELEVVTLVGGG